MIASAQSNQSSYCRGIQGSDFTTKFIQNFDGTYPNTLETLFQYNFKRKTWLWKI